MIPIHYTAFAYDFGRQTGVIVVLVKKCQSAENLRNHVI